MMQDRIFIEDLGSTNGTRVNGQSIDNKGPTSVMVGDLITIGSVVLTLQVAGA
jgi:pSer/pThr/pTyr-binding forkhead associated (FHA) protein